MQIDRFPFGSNKKAPQTAPFVNGVYSAQLKLWEHTSYVKQTSPSEIKMKPDEEGI